MLPSRHAPGLHTRPRARALHARSPNPSPRTGWLAAVAALPVAFGLAAAPVAAQSPSSPQPASRPPAVRAPAAAPVPGATRTPAPDADAIPASRTGESGAPRYTLARLLELARAGHPALAAAQADVRAAQAGTTTARAWPNPEVEAMAGRQRAREAAAPEGATGALSFTQRLDTPWQRGPRMQAADAAFAVSQAQSRSRSRDIEARLVLLFYTVLRREAELQNAREDVALVEQIRRRVAVRVGIGEAPRYELIRGDAELLNAQRNEQAAALRVDQALADLRRAVGTPLPPVFGVDPGAEQPIAVGRPLPPLGGLIDAVLAAHPDLVADRAEVRQAEARLALERGQRLPTLAVRGTVDRQPDLQDNRVGLLVSIPVFDRREGPIAEALASLDRARARLGDRELQMRQAVEGAYRQYQIAESQVGALESGVVAQAESALRVAEVAYRQGERGILEYLDAQRIFRQARNDLITARADLRAAAVELDRLRLDVP